MHLESLVKLSSLDIGYVPWSSSSMTPRAITYILSEIILNKRRRVLELGMGISTLYIAKLMMEQEQVSLLSIDNDASWIEVCRDQIRSKRLGSAAHKILHAPLKRLSGESGLDVDYYDVEAFKHEVESFSPDMLIVDGPPAWRPEIASARVPAHQFLAPFLSSDSTVFIDDYTRPGESRLIDLFLGSSGWSVALRDPLANVAILRSSSANFNVF